MATENNKNMVKLIQRLEEVIGVQNSKIGDIMTIENERKMYLALLKYNMELIHMISDRSEKILTDRWG